MVNDYSIVGLCGPNSHSPLVLGFWINKMLICHIH